MLTFGVALDVNFRRYLIPFFDADTELNRSRGSSQYDEIKDNDSDSLDWYQSNISGYYKFNIWTCMRMEMNVVFQIQGWWSFVIDSVFQTESIIRQE